MFNKIIKTKHGGSTVATNATAIRLAPQLTTISNNQAFLREYNSENSPFILFLSAEAIRCLKEADQWDFFTFKKI